MEIGPSGCSQAPTWPGAPAPCACAARLDKLHAPTPAGAPAHTAPAAGPLPRADAPPSPHPARHALSTSPEGRLLSPKEGSPGFGAPSPSSIFREPPSDPRRARIFGVAPPRRPSPSRDALPATGNVNTDGTSPSRGGGYYGQGGQSRPTTTLSFFSGTHACEQAYREAC